MKKSKDSAYLLSVPLDDASSLDSQVFVKMHEITNSSSVSEFADAEEDSQKMNTGHQSQISLRMYEVHPNFSPPECFESKDDGHCNISQDVWTYSMNRMNQDECNGILYLDMDSISDATDGKESADSDDKYKESSGSGYFTCHSRNDEIDGIISDIRGIMSRQRSESIASLEYYRSQDVHLQISAREELQGQVQDVPVNNRHMRQSRRLPFWLWFIIAKSLGIKLNPQDKPIAATVLYTLTFMSALGYFLSNWWFTAYDIVSDYTKTTVIDGTISIFFCLLWGALGIYANKLAYKLFSHKKFLDMLRLHSKTILKMNASVVLFTLLLMIAIFNDVNAYTNFLDETCHKVSVEVLVCKVRYIFRVLYSAFAVIWNYLVAFVLISTCRTHVIGIRRFMQALEQDARAYESRYMGLAQQGSSERPVLEEYTWVDEDYLDELCDPGGSDFDSNSSALIPQQRNREDLEQGENQNSSGLPSTRVLSSTTSEESVPSSASSPSDNSLENSLPQPAEVTHSNKVQILFYKYCS
ncbi:uncharacterized protein [Panulirus ornatus]|uniref:uncharacterized protein isoform X2 n=1 Tax=Panulirus ornatus TaxID=150431 RepID=UPI003A8B5B3A